MSSSPGPCCGQTWSDPKVPHYCQLLHDDDDDDHRSSEPQDHTSLISNHPTSGSQAGQPPAPDRATCTSNAAPGTSESIQVYIRVRPKLSRECPNTNDKDSGNKEFIHIDANATSIRIATPTSNATCEFDHVFQPETTQAQVYAKVEDCTQAALEGFNTCLFAYGQTGSGTRPRIVRDIHSCSYIYSQICTPIQRSYYYSIL